MQEIMENNLYLKRFLGLNTKDRETTLNELENNK